MTTHIRALGVTRPEQMSNSAHDRRASVRDLAQALKAGDLGAASDAYAKLSAMAPKRAERNPDGGFARIGAALAAGDLGAARSAFASIFTSHLPAGGERAPVAPVADPAAPTRSGRGLLDVSA
jgi:hypothetical protein